MGQTPVVRLPVVYGLQFSYPRRMEFVCGIESNNDLLGAASQNVNVLLLMIIDVLQPAKAATANAGHDESLAGCLADCRRIPLSN